MMNSPEPLARTSDWVSLMAIICGIAPIPFGLLSMVPIVGCLSTPVMLLAVPAAIGFGIAGIVRASNQPEPNYVQPVTGLVLGLSWLVLTVGAVVWFLRGPGKDFENLLRH